MRAGIECKISLAKRLPITLGGSTSLSFSLADFTNASDRYVYSKNPSSGLYEVTGPFAGGSLATKSIGGKNCAQIFRAVTEDIPATSMIQDLSVGNYYKPNVAITTNDTIDPLGGSAADRVDANVAGPAEYYLRAQASAVTSGEYNVFGVFMKKNTTKYSGITVFQGAQYGARLNFDTGVVDTLFNAPAGSGVLKFGDGWYFLYIIYLAAATASLYRYLYLLNDAGDYSYAQSGESVYLWGVTDERSSAFPSYLKLIKQAYAKDVLIWPAAYVPNWLKGSQNQAFTFNIMPYYSSTALALDGGRKYLFSVDGTESIECYLDGADNKIKIDVDTVNKFSSTAKTWDAFDNPKISIIPNTGSGCRVITSGFDSGDGDETGTAFSMQTDGDLSCASMHTTDDQQLDGLISEFRKGLV